MPRRPPARAPAAAGPAMPQGELYVDIPSRTSMRMAGRTGRAGPGGGEAGTRPPGTAPRGRAGRAAAPGGARTR